MALVISMKRTYRILFRGSLSNGINEVRTHFWSLGRDAGLCANRLPQANPLPPHSSVQWTLLHPLPRRGHGGTHRGATEAARGGPRVRGAAVQLQSRHSLRITGRCN